MQHGLEGSKKQKKTPLYIGNQGVSTPRYLGLFWIFSGSSFASPQYIGHRGVLTLRYIGPRGVSTLRCIGHRGVILKCLWEQEELFGGKNRVKKIS